MINSPLATLQPTKTCPDTVKAEAVNRNLATQPRIVPQLQTHQVWKRRAGGPSINECGWDGTGEHVVVKVQLPNGRRPIRWKALHLVVAGVKVGQLEEL